MSASSANCKTIVLYTLYVLCFCFFISVVSVTSVGAQANYPETISALRTAYQNEMTAFHAYIAYAEKAESEGYPNIAQLFMAIANSESIHARNFKRILTELKVDVKEMPPPKLTVLTTKENLKYLTEKEIKEIDQTYPSLIERIKPEKHEAAIHNMSWAWKSEEQHRDLLKKIHSGTGMLFRAMAKIIEITPMRSFVCQVCGSTILKLPTKACPICGNPVSNYKKIGK
ncbi:MAG: rubrerythrin family protein [Syntrophales bacterium]|nr:rubrerythrin family protein [Syntrophales bacterium]